MTTLGVIRWDNWYADGGSADPVRRCLSKVQYRDRAPAHSVLEKPGNALRFVYDQATIDAEIAAAAPANLHWVFLFYSRPSPLMNAFDLFQTSAHKADIDWCMMRPADDFGTTGAYAAKVSETVALMGQSNYKKVMSGRPLLYVYYVPTMLDVWGYSLANFKAALDAVRAGAIAAGLANPYIVLTADIGSIVSAKVALGVDAVTSYISGVNPGPGKDYADLRADDAAYWATMAATGFSTVPIVMAGWDRRPRIERPVQWEPYQKPHIGMDQYYASGTDAQIVAHLADAKAYALANPSICPANTLLLYAWNEHDEGGWLAPTLGDPDGDRLATLAAANLFTR